MDSRIQIIKRQFIIDFDDETPLPFTNKDLELIAENFEYELQKKFALKITNIDVKDVKELNHE